jgi:hypothetical protein
MLILISVALIVALIEQSAAQFSNNIFLETVAVAQFSILPKHSAISKVLALVAEMSLRLIKKSCLLIYRPERPSVIGEQSRGGDKQT